jgi:hypothetical protein
MVGSATWAWPVAHALVREREMLDEGYTRGDAVPAPNDPPIDEASVGGVGAGGAPRFGQVESVPSEQLWRAAILAARQAALSAAELRRALEERTAPPVVPPSPDGGAASLVT